MVKTNLNKGYVTQIIGPVLDIKFSEGNLPPIYSAIRIPLEDGTETVEVQQLLGDNRMCVQTFQSVVDLSFRYSIMVLVPNIRSNFNVIGEPVDEQGDVSYDGLPIHREAPAFTELETKPSILKLVLK
jgi:F-type H+-transporting ATPase subunit beta